MDVTAAEYDLYPDGLLPIPAKKLADLLVLSAFLTDEKAAYYKGLVGDAGLDSETEEDSEEEAIEGEI
jgi:hypothetical protein